MKKPATKAAAKPLDPLRVGNAVFIRAVTHYYTGRIVAIEPDRVLLGEAAWVADTGRWNKALTEGAASLAEVEPYPDGVCGVMRGAIVDYCNFPGELPRAVK